MSAPENKTCKGSWPVILTPFDKNLRIDYAVYEEMIEWYINNGSGGIYTNCLSSEMYHLELNEQLQLIQKAIQISNSRLPIATTGNFGDNVQEHLESIKEIGGTGIDVLMLVVPTFLSTEDELERYFFNVIENTDIPLGLYECPIPRSFHLSIELVKKLAETGRFVAYKETSCKIDKIKSHIDNCRNTKLSVMQANLPYLLESIRYGATGSMNIASIWLPDLIDKIIELGHKNDPKADDLHSDLCLLEMMQRVVHPKGTKYLLSKRGVNILQYSRAVKKELSEELLYALDRISEKWIRKDGSLNIQF